MTEIGKTSQPFRYIVVEWEIDEENHSADELVSRHRTKVAAIRAEQLARKRTEGYDNLFVSAAHWNADNSTYRIFTREDYTLCLPEQFGECGECQRYERPCSQRQKNGKCPYTKTGPWRVYALLDPNSGQIRYIGSTEQPLQKRLSGHLCRATSREAREWIQSLLADGQKPLIQEIAQHSTRKEALLHEANLINSTPKLVNGHKTPQVPTRSNSSSSKLDP